MIKSMFLRTTVTLLFMSLTTSTALAEVVGGYCGPTNREDELTWKYDPSSKKLTIKKESGTMGRMQGYSSASEQPWYSYRTDIQAIELDGVIVIGQYAFAGLSNLASVKIPSTVTTISAHAFYQCRSSSFTSISLPSSIQNIGNSAFRECIFLTSFTIPDQVTAISASLFYGCTSLTSITIPNGVKSIGAGAFRYCSNLKNISLPDGLTTIDSNAFEECSNLESFTVPKSVTSIGTSVFKGCSKITSINVDAENTNYLSDNGVLYNIDKTMLVECPKGNTGSITIPASVESICREAFSGCTNLTSITLAEGSALTTIGEYAFSGCSNLTSLTLAEGSALTTIGEYAFQDCAGLTSFTIPDGVSSIKRAFYGCPSLESVTIPSSMTTIDMEAFYNCTSLSEVNIPSSVTTIGRNAFDGCTSLVSIHLPAGLTSLIDRTFMHCSSLASISIPATVTTMGYSVFDGCRNLATAYVYSPAVPYNQNWNFDHIDVDFSIYVYNSLVDDYKTTNWWSQYSEHIKPITITAKEVATGEYWSTYYNEYADIIVPEGVQVFKVEQNGTSLSLTKIDDRIITKGEGVVLKSNSANILPEYSESSSATSYSDNSLYGTMTNITNPGNAYVLNNGSNGLGFYRLKASGTIGANKAYLTYTAPSSAPSYNFLGFNQETTGIKSSLQLDQTESGTVYDLQGRRVEHPTKGLYIMNGHKVIIK